jgi:hypothetical protein
MLAKTFLLRSNAVTLGLARPLAMGFASPTKKIGQNDALKDAQKEAKKFGIKRRFYDHLPTIARQLPQGL